MTSVYHCHCPCKTNQFAITGAPMTRFFCHCTICQEKYQAPYADVVLFPLGGLTLPESHSISFGQYKRFGAIDRGVCTQCHQPAMAKAGEGAKGLAFIAAHNIANPELLPAASMHVFYGTRVADVEDSLPKYRHYLSSQFAFLKLLLTRSRT